MDLKARERNLVEEVASASIIPSVTSYLALGNYLRGLLASNLFLL
jgi:hypothetical protein